jgi:hypothetical protein
MGICRLSRYALVVASLLSPCEQLPVSAATNGLSIPAAPPTPACEAGSDYGCFVPAVPEPGVDIPQQSLTFSMRPAADNAFYIVTLKNGWFKNVGLTIEPQPYGFRATDENAIPLCLKNQNNIGAIFGGSVIQTLRTSKNLKMIMFTDDFLGHFIWADPKLNLRPVGYYIKQGLPFEAALRKTLEPITISGQKLATSATLDTRPFIDTAFGLARLQVPSLLLVEDPENLVLARSGKSPFSVPVHSSTALTLKNEGWTPLVGIGDLLDNVKGGTSSPVENLVFTIGLMANREFVENHQNATLRFVSAVFRTIDAILADKGKSGGLLSTAYPFINAYNGTDLNEEGTYFVYSVLDPLVSWNDQQKYFVDRSDPRYYKIAYKAFIDTNVASHVLPAGLVPDDGIWAGQIYATLRWYQTQTDAILKSLATADLNATQKSLWAKAKQYYSWYDFLDAFRLAKAAAQ